jgi:hypothetical protein
MPKSDATSDGKEESVTGAAVSMWITGDSVA